MFTWINDHMEIIKNIFIPVLVAIIGIFSIKTIKKYLIKGNNNNILSSEGDMKNTDSLNTVNKSPGAVNISGNNNQVHIHTIHDAQQVAEKLVESIYPFINEPAFQEIKSNVANFLNCFKREISEIKKSDLEKFSTASVTIALQNAIIGASQHSSTDAHQILCRLVADRVQKPKSSTAELSIQESIKVIEKLDINHIKILALNFIFSKTKYTQLPDETALVNVLSLVETHFQGLDISIPKFEYLEAISCGKYTPFSNSFMGVIIKNYPHLFHKKIPFFLYENQLNYPPVIKTACFLNLDNKNIKLNPLIGLYLFENAQITFNGDAFIIDDESIKKKLINLFNQHRLSENEIKKFLLDKNPALDNLLKMWDQNGFSQFSLTSVGVAIAVAYLEKKGLGNFDINTFIN